MTTFTSSDADMKLSAVSSAEVLMVVIDITTTQRLTLVPRGEVHHHCPVAVCGCGESLSFILNYYVLRDTVANFSRNIHSSG